MVATKVAEGPGVGSKSSGGPGWRARLVYDRGTILVDLPDGVLVPQGLFRDPRVDQYRALAHKYSELVRSLAGQGVAVQDQVRRWARGLEVRPPGLRPYQREALWAWERAGCKGLVCLPTGSGKTLVGLAAAASLGVSTLILAPTRVLVHQWAERVSSIYSGEVGIVGDGIRRVRPITVATFESAFRRAEDLGDKFGLLVVDEAHHFASGLRAEALELSAAPCRIGLTATPPGDPEAVSRLGALIGPEVFRMDVADLRGRYLADYDWYVLPVRLTSQERLAYDREMALFNREYRVFKATWPRGTWPDFVDWARHRPEGVQALAAWHAAQKILSLARGKTVLVGGILERHQDRRILIFTKDNAAAYEIARRFLIPPITCHTRPKERRWLLDGFASGEIRALVSARVLNEGLDVPDADVAVLLGGSHGTREFVQRVGRVLRPGPGKHALIYEVVVAETSESRRLSRHAQALATRRSGPSSRASGRSGAGGAAALRK